MLTVKSITGLGALLLAAGVLGGAVSRWLAPSSTAGAQPASVTAGRFILLDEQGIQRGVLEMTADGNPRLTVVGRNSQTPRVSVAVDRNQGPYVALVDEGGSTRAAMEVRQDGTVVTGVYGSRTLTPSAALRLEPDGTASLDLRDRADRLRASLGVTPDGSPFLSLLNEQGEVTWTAP